MTEAAASTSLVNSSDSGLFGFSRKPSVAVLGTNSCNSASPLAPSSALNSLKPVKLPPGRLRLATSPSCAGSAAAVNTIGMLVVAALAARVDTSPDVTITATRSSRQCWQSVSLVSRPAIFDRQVPAFNVTGLVQTSPEAGQPGGIGLRRPVV